MVKEKNKRTFHRFRTSLPGRLVAESTQEECEVFLRNTSATGVLVRTDQFIGCRRKIDLLVKSAAGENPVRLKGKIVWHNQITEKVWEIGIEFKKIELNKMCRLYNCSHPN